MKVMEKGHKNSIFPYIFLIGVVLICGCAATAAYKKLYEGPEKPISDIAILTEPNPYLFRIPGQRWPCV